MAEKRPRPRIPEEVMTRLTAASDPTAQRAEGIRIAVDTVVKLSEMKGLRGFEIRGDEDGDLALEVIEQSGLRTE